MTFKELRKKSGMSRSQFGEYFGIPYRTVQNWELGLRECPEYLLNLIYYKLVKQEIIEPDFSNMFMNCNNLKPLPMIDTVALMKDLKKKK